MIKFLFYIIAFPFIFVFVMGYYMLYFIGYMCYLLIKFVIWLIQLIFGLFSHGGVPSFDIKSPKVKSYSKKKVKQSSFDRQADFWGLSKEDRKIAKQERMSPADYIEAEERDDDELDTDEWE